MTEVGGGDSCVDGQHSNRTKSDVAWDANRRPFLSALSACADAGGHGGALNRYISASTPVDALGRCADSMGGTLLWWGKQTRGHRAVAEHYRLPVFTTLGAWARVFERGDGQPCAEGGGGLAGHVGVNGVGEVVGEVAGLFDRLCQLAVRFGRLGRPELQ